jgi:hypothetical protein
MMTIYYLKQADIDKTKWNYCIENAINCMVYGMSWYLDEVCENWDGLILDDYQAVMPLPWKSKFGIKYIYHPFFAQQLGVFFQKQQHNQVDKFVRQIPSKFMKVEFSMNAMNKVNSLLATKRINYVLNINSGYPELYKAFNENTKRKIKKGEKNYSLIREDISISDFLTLKKQNSVTRISDRQYDILKSLFTVLIEKKHAKIIGVFNEENELQAAAIFVSFKNRIIYLFSASSEEGKNKSAMFAVVNKVIKENSGQNKVLDFEGSMIEGIARFFQGFGAVAENYYRVQKSKIAFIK